MNRSTLLIRSLLLLALATLAAGVPAVLAGNENHGVLPIHSHPHGQSYGEWGAK